MSRELYNYKRKATTVNEVARIMKKAREDYVYEE